MNKTNVDVERLWEQVIHWNPRLKHNVEQKELITKKLQDQLVQSHAVVLATKLDIEYEEVAKRCESKIYELKRILGQSSRNHSTIDDLNPLNEHRGEDVKVEELQDSDCDSNEKLSVIAKRSQKSRSSNESRVPAAKNTTLVDTEQMPVALRKAPRKRKTPSNYKFQSSPTKSSLQDHSIVRRKQSVIYCNEEEVNCNHEPQHSLYIEMPSLFVWHPKHRIRLGNKVNQLVFGNVVNQAKQKASRQDTSLVQQEKDLMTTFCSSSVSTYQQNQEEIEFSQFVEDIMIGDGSEDEETWQAARALECINNNALDNLETTVERHFPLSQSSNEVPILCEPTTSKRRRKSVKSTNNGQTKKRGRKPKNKNTLAVEPPTKSNLAQYVENFANDCDLRGSTTPAASSTMSQPLVTSTTQNFEFIDQQNSRSVMCYFEGDWPNGTACQFLTSNGLTINGTQVDSENANMNLPLQDNTLDGSIGLPISIPLTSLEFENLTNSRPIQQTSELQNSLVQPVFNIQIPPLPAFPTTIDTSSVSNGTQFPPPAHTATDCALDLSAKSKEVDVSNALMKFSNLSNSSVMSIEQATDDDTDNAPLDLSVKPVTTQCIEDTGPPAGQDQELPDFQYVVEHDGQFYDFTRCLNDLGFDDNGKPYKGKDMPLLDSNDEPEDVLMKDSTKPLSFDSNYITMADETSDNQTSILGQEFQFANRSTKEIFDNLLDICDENDNESNVPFLGFDNITFDSNEIQNSTACGVLDNLSKVYDVDKDKKNAEETYKVNAMNAIETSTSQTVPAITNNTDDRDFPKICESSRSTSKKGDDNHLLNISISAENNESPELHFKVRNDSNVDEFVEDLSKSSGPNETAPSSSSKTFENCKEIGEKCPKIVTKSIKNNANVDKCSGYMRTEKQTAVLARSKVDGCHYKNVAQSPDNIDIKIHPANCNVNAKILTVSDSKNERIVEAPKIKPKLTTKSSKPMNNFVIERAMQDLDSITLQKPTTDIELSEVESIRLVTKSNSINCDKTDQSKYTETDSKALNKKIVFSVAKVDLRDEASSSLHYMFAQGSDAIRKKSEDINLPTGDDNIFNLSKFKKNTAAASECCSDSSLPTPLQIPDDYKVNAIENHRNELQGAVGQCEYSKKITNCFETSGSMSLVDENASQDISKDYAFPKLNSSMNSVIIGGSSIIGHTKDELNDELRQVNPSFLLQNENKNDVCTKSSVVLEENEILKANNKDKLQSQHNQISGINNLKISDNDNHCSEDFKDDSTTSEVCEDSDQEFVDKRKCMPNGQAGTIPNPNNLDFSHMSLLEMESNLEQENLDYDEDFDDALSLETSCFNSPNDNRFMEPLVYESDSSTIERSSSITPNITNVITSINHTTIPKINATPSADGLKNFKIPLLKKRITAELPTREGTRKQSITCKGVSDINHFTLQPSVRLERICFSEEGKIIQKKSANSDVNHKISNHVPIKFENFTRTIQNEISAAATTSGDLSHVQQQPHQQHNTQTVKYIFGKSSFDIEKQRLPLSTVGNDVVTNGVSKIFGITCIPHLADLCDKPPTVCGHSHQLNNKDIVFTTLCSLNNVQLLDAYSFMYNHQKLYKSYFLVFCNLYTMRKDRDKLLSMVTDCERYPQYSEFVILLYEGLLNVGLNRANACRLLLQQCREKSPQFIDALVAIIMKSDWTMFTNYIESYTVTEYRFRFGTLDQMSRSVLKSNDVHLKQVFGKCVQMLHKDDTVLLASMPNVLEWVNLLMNP